MSNDVSGVSEVNEYVGKAISYSWRYSEKYRGQHVGGRWGIGESQATTLAISRLQWLLVEGRKSLSGRFTKEEFRQLMNCFQAEIFDPDMFRDFAVAVAQESGVDEVILDGGKVPKFIKKLLKLSPLEDAALADALEQAWYRSGGELDHFGVLEELGIELK